MSKVNGSRAKSLSRGRLVVPELVLFLILWAVPARPAVAQEEPHSILVLASYEPGNGLEEAQIAGLRETLPLDAELLIDHLDITWTGRRKNYLPLYFGIVYRKYSNRHFDAIVALNDDAIRFVDYFQTNLFARYPLVVCGTQTNVMTAMPGLTNWTGVFCAPDPEKTIQMSLALHPRARVVHVITDLTTPGRQAWTQIHRAITNQHFSAHVIQPGPEEVWTYGRLRREALQFGRGSTVFFAEFSRDYRGMVFLPHRLMPLLSADSSAPIYTMQAQTIGVGAVGGFVVNGEQMGRAAGDILRRMLAGDVTADIPPVIQEGEWIFDDVQLKRWGINERRLPKGSRIIGKKESFFAKNKWILLAGSTIAGAELAVIALLLINRAGRLRAQRELQASETRYRTLFESSDDMFTILDQDGAVLHANPATCRLLGYPLEELVGKKHADLIAPADRLRVRQGLDLVLGGGRILLEPSCLTREGGGMPVECLMQPLHAGGQTAAVCFARSLSERIKIQRLMQEISERERQAIGHDIHDGLGQYLSALRFWCRRLEMADGSRPPEAGAVAKLSQIAAELAFEVRSLARSLVPLQMLSRTLESALQELMETNQRHFRLQATLDFSLDENRLTPEAAAQLYRIAQEALRNAVRHAGATGVRVVLHTTGENQAELVVENDGKPFTPPPEQRAGMGLAIMEQRARLIGGKFEIEAVGETGTRITCRFPLQPVRIGTAAKKA